MTGDKLLKDASNLFFDFLLSHSFSVFGTSFTLLDIAIGLLFVGILGFIFFKIFD